MSDTKEMEYSGRGPAGTYFEHGIESVDPDDDFAYWVTSKQVEESGRRLARLVRDGLINMSK